MVVVRVFKCGVVLGEEGGEWIRDGGWLVSFMMYV